VACIQERDLNTAYLLMILEIERRNNEVVQCSKQILDTDFVRQT
jgi:hypothetical protein